MVNSGTIIGSTYAQVVGVTVTDTEILLEFVYINPRDKNKGEVVSRVTLPRAVGEELAQLISKTITVHEESKKGKTDE